MRNSFKTMLILALGAVSFTLSSCSEDPITEPDPVPAETKCYITEQTETFPASTTITYAYNDDNQVISATKGSEVTTFEYTNTKLTTATSGTTVSTFVYTGDVLARINETKDGEDVGYIFLTNTNEKLTKVETHNTTSGEDVIETITTIGYDADGNITSLETQQANSSNDDFDTQFSLTSVETDGKLNPFSTSLAYFFMNTGNPKAFGESNITSGAAEVQGFPATYSATIEYNANNYATAINATITNVAGSVPAPTTITYNCK